MSDVAQILGVASSKGGGEGGENGSGTPKSELDQLKPSGPSPAGKASSQSQNKQRRMTGMQREVLELLQSNHRANHGVLPSTSKLSMVQKWRAQKDKPATKWTRKPFKNPARKDLIGEQGTGLILSHWGKVQVEQPEYVFARFNVHCDVVSYTDDQYKSVIEPHEDPLMSDWDKPQTDLLFSLCQKFDLRWPIVLDRFSASHSRSMEELKYRYYTIASILQSSNTFAFDLAYERQRKQQLDLQFHRSPAEEQEITALTSKLKSLESQLKKQAAKIDSKKKKEVGDIILASFQPQQTPGVSLRSARLDVPVANAKSRKKGISAKMAQKMQSFLDELGVPPRPMPTLQVVDMLDKVRQDAVTLLSLRKQLEKKRKQAIELREQYKRVTGKEPPMQLEKVARHEKEGDKIKAAPKAAAPSGKTGKQAEKGRSNKRRGPNLEMPSKRNRKN